MHRCHTLRFRVHKRDGRWWWRWPIVDFFLLSLETFLSGKFFLIFFSINDDHEDHARDFRRSRHGRASPQTCPQETQIEILCDGRRFRAQLQVRDERRTVPLHDEVRTSLHDESLLWKSLLWKSLLWKSLHDEVRMSLYDESLLWKSLHGQTSFFSMRLSVFSEVCVQDFSRCTTTPTSIAFFPFVSPPFSQVVLIKIFSSRSLFSGARHIPRPVANSRIFVELETVGTIH